MYPETTPVEHDRRLLAGTLFDDAKSCCLPIPPAYRRGH